MIGNCPSTPLRILSRSCGWSSSTKPRIVTNDEHQREQRDEPVVGDQRRQLAGLVVAELLHHRRQEADPAAALLAAVEPFQALAEAHRQLPKLEGGLDGPAVDILMCLLDRRVVTRDNYPAGRSRIARDTADAVHEVALVAQARRDLLLRAHRFRLREGGSRGLLFAGDARADRPGPQGCSRSAKTDAPRAGPREAVRFANPRSSPRGLGTLLHADRHSSMPRRSRGHA